MANPTIADLIRNIGKEEFGDNISICDAEVDEYYPVELISRATEEDGLLDEGHLILTIKIPQTGG